MMTVAQASQLIHQHLPDWGEETVSLADPRAEMALEALTADRAYPPADRVMMDGIALAWASYEKGQRQFLILGTVAAGDPPQSLTDSQACLEVMTGAVLPQGTDLVIPYEHLTIQAGQAQITLEQTRQPGDNIHPAQSDCSAGAVILAAPLALNGPRWGIAASFGQTHLRCRRRPKVKLIATGNELLAPDDQPQAHQLRRSNVYALQASLRLQGYPVVAIDQVADDPEALAEHYQTQTTEYDILIYSGGVSKGKFDYLPGVWKSQGVRPYVQGVAQRPGKPLWFGVDPTHNTAVFGLPGNPISSLVCLHRYLFIGPGRYAQLTESITFKPDLTYFLPVKIEYSLQAQILAHPLPMKNSGEFVALAQSDGFLELPQHLSHFKAGQSFPFYSWWPW